MSSQVTKIVETVDMKLQWPEHKSENNEEHTSCFDLWSLFDTLTVHHCRAES